MDYLAIKHAHMGLAGISILGFMSRSCLLFLYQPWFGKRWIRRVVDLVDTLLLLTAVMLVVMSGQYPWMAAWVLAKILGLIAYIGCGIWAFRFARSTQSRLLAVTMALLSAGYIVSVAISKNSYGFFAFFADRI